MLDDPTSHTHAAIAGWKFAPTIAEILHFDRLDADIWIATARKDRAKLKPLRRPWLPDAAKPAAPVMTDEKRSRLKKWADRALGR